MGSPSIFVYDCSNAGIIVKSFKQFALQREQELEVGTLMVYGVSTHSSRELGVGLSYKHAQFVCRQTWRNELLVFMSY